MLFLLAMYSLAEPVLNSAFHFKEGQTCLSQRRIPQALACFDRAIEFGYPEKEGINERRTCAMLMGDFDRAWQECERYQRLVYDNPSKLAAPKGTLWDGTPLTGKRVLVRCEHGLGDTIQLIRLCRPLKKIATKVTVKAQKELIPLLKGKFDIDRLITLEANEPEFDVVLEVSELPFALKLSPSEIPFEPFLQKPDGRAFSRLRVGVAWGTSEFKPERGLPFALLAHALRHPGIELISLQRGPATEEANAFLDWPELRSVEAPKRIEDTISLIQTLDLVITVDSLIAHLAGTSNVTTWTLLHTHSDWRWMLDQDDTPWYPTMRLFRQKEVGNWQSPLAEVSAHLRMLLTERRKVS